MPKKYTVKVNYEEIVDAIDNHKVYRGNNTSFCLDMGFENRTSWVSDLKRGRNLPSPEEAAKMCSLLKKAPDEILLHQGETEEQTAKCQKDIALVRDLLDQQRQDAKKETPDPTIEGKRSTVSSFIRESTDASVLLDIMNEVAQKLKELEKKNGK